MESKTSLSIRIIGIMKWSQLASAVSIRYHEGLLSEQICLTLMRYSWG